jgi:simple sugar transport system permease protein
MEITTAERSERRLSAKLKRFLLTATESPEIAAFITLLLVFLFFAFSAPNFLTAYALSNVLTFASIYGIVVVGVALMISGEFDLSVGSNGCGGIYFLVSSLAGIPRGGMLLALGVSVLGLINGLIVVLRASVFYCHPGDLLAYRARSALGGGQVTSYNPESKPLFAVLNDYIAPLNQLFDPAGNFRISSLWFVGLVIVASFVLMRTPHGNWTFAVGGNPGAALAQGVNVKRIKLSNFVLSGFLAGLAGVILLRSALDE